MKLRKLSAIIACSAALYAGGSVAADWLSVFWI